MTIYKIIDSLFLPDKKLCFLSGDRALEKFHKGEQHSQIYFTLGVTW